MMKHNSPSMKVHFIPPEAADQKPVSLAARELEAHLSMLKAKPEDMELFLYLTDEKEEDSYEVEATASGIIIRGQNTRSVLLGVYAYLRKIGFVFAYPGEGGTLIPKIEDASKLCVAPFSETPSYHHRGVCIEGADSLQNVLDFVEWLPKNGYNSFFMQFHEPDVFFNRWYRHENNPHKEPEDVTKEQLSDMADLTAQAVAERGLMDHRVGHGWTARSLGFSSTGWYRESRELSEDETSLLAKIGGKRALWHGVPTMTQLCYANPEARRRLVGSVVSYVQAHPEVSYVHFWLADAFNNICECEECRKTTPTDQYIEILNELDEALTRESLSAKIVFLLYLELLYPPKKEKIHNPERFCLMFAPISRSFETPYPSLLDAPSPPSYVRNQVKLPESVEENLAFYKAWKESFSGDSFFYDYHLGRAHYGDFGYMKISRTIYEDVRRLHELGTRGLMSCQELRVASPTAFPNYVMGQTLLSPEISFEELVHTYFSGMFGPDYAPALRYLSDLSVLSDTDYFKGNGKRLQSEKKAAYEKMIGLSKSFMESCGAFSSKDPKYAHNWTYLKFHAEYVVRLSRALAFLCSGEEEKAKEAFSAFCGFIQINEDYCQSRLDVFRILEITTNYTGFPRIQNERGDCQALPFSV